MILQNLNLIPQRDEMNNQHISTGGILMEPTESKTSRGDHLQCDICLKSFPDAALLSLHHWIHAGSSSDPPPLATVKELFEPETLIKPEEIKEELADINEQEDENTDKDKIEQNLNEDNTHQELMKCENIKVEAADSDADPLMLSDKSLLDEPVSIASVKEIEKQKFIDTCMIALKQHHARKVEEQIATEPVGIRYSCDQCDYFAASQSNIFEHKRRKHDRVQYSCEQCEYKATTKAELWRHTVSKHDKIRYLCDQCNVSFKYKSGLRNHKSIHAGIKYPCNQCDFAAKTAGRLKQHKAAIHEGIKYSCDQCDRAFTNLRLLKQHKTSEHDGIRFSCEQCDHTTTTLGDLKKHKASMHDGISYPCDQCNYCATQVGNLRRHKAKKHP